MPSGCGMTESKAGFLLMGPSLAPIYANSEAIRILAYPEDPKRFTSPSGYISKKVQSVLMEGRSSRSTFVAEFTSGKRRHLCRTFSLGSDALNDFRQPTVAVVLERKVLGSLDSFSAASRFNLTSREQEAIEFLVLGLTNKEIANRMNISPNTVKAFIKLIMMKMRVSTRSAVVSTILIPERNAIPA